MGWIIDYIGIVKALRKALADYTANVGGQNGADPTVDKEELIARILDTISAAKDYLSNHGFNLQDLIDAEYFDRMALLKDGADAVKQHAGRPQEVPDLRQRVDTTYEVC